MKSWDNKDKNKARVFKLNAQIDDLGFPRDDCRKIADSVAVCDFIIADVNTYFHSLWSLSAIDKLLKLPTEELVRYRTWLEKSFFERFPKYLQGKEFITPHFTPTLYKGLKINEELRLLISKIISDELNFRAQETIL